MCDMRALGGPGKKGVEGRRSLYSWNRPGRLDKRRAADGLVPVSSFFARAKGAGDGPSSQESLSARAGASEPKCQHVTNRKAIMLPLLPYVERSG